MATTREILSNLYVGYFNRAADPEGLAYWVARMNEGMSIIQIAQSFSVQREVITLYGELTNSNLSGNPTAQVAFMSALYSNLFNRSTIDPVGMAYWVNQINSGIPVGRIIQDVISGAQGDDATIVFNRVIVAEAFTARLSSQNVIFSLDAARTAITGVTALQSSITTALATFEALINPPVVTPPPVVVSPPPPPPPPPPPLALDGDKNANILTGTPGVDEINGLGGDDTLNGLGDADTLDGGTGDDIFLFNTNDIASGESIDGGDGTDTASVVTSTNFTGMATPTLRADGNVEQLLITSGQKATFAGSQLSGQAIAINATGAGTATLTINAAGTVNFSGLTFAAFGTNNAFDSGTDIINITTSTGADDVTGSSHGDFIFSSLGADKFSGGDGNDVFTYYGSATGNDYVLGDTINGGAGDDGVLAYYSTDFRGLTNPTTPLTDAANSIERIFIKTKGNGDDTALNFDTFATFNGSQLHDQKISVNTFNDPNVMDSTKIAALNIIASGTQDFSKLSFTKVATTNPDVAAFSNVNGELVYIFGSTGADTLTGTSINDIFLVSNGGDTLNGGTGFDSFFFQTGDLAAGMTINGGGDTDSLFALASTNFTGLNTNAKLLDNSIERVLIGTKGVNAITATFDGKQLSDQTININTFNFSTPGANVATLSINAAGTANFSGLTFNKSFATFNAFVSGTDIININGSAGDDFITGTTFNDTINAGDGFNVIYSKVGTGADVMNGGNGVDTFWFFGDAVTMENGEANGDTINGGGGAFDGIVAYNSDFRGMTNPTLTQASIERVFIVTQDAFDNYATFNGSQLHNQAIAINKYNDPNVVDTGKFAALYIAASGANNNFSQLTFADTSIVAGFDAFTPTANGDRIFIVGSAGADTIVGTISHDFIYGEAGADILTGGAGFDGFGFDGAAGATISGIVTGDIITDFVTGGTDKLFFYNVTEVASAQQAAVQTAVTALAGGSTAAQIATAMATANTTDLGVSSAIFEGDTYVYFERTGNSSGVAADDVFIKLTGVASGFSFAGDVFVV